MPLAALTITVPKTWRSGFVIDFTTPAPAPNQYNVYVDSVLLRSYFTNDVTTNPSTHITRILVSSFPTNETNSNVSVQVSYVYSGVESTLSNVITVDCRTALSDTLVSTTDEATYFIP